MKKQAKIRLASFTTAFVFVLGGFLLQAKLMNKNQGTQLEYTYLRALNDLSDTVSGLRFTLQKAAYVNTPTLVNAVCAKVLEESGTAKSAMAVLPLSQEKSQTISRFLSQAGDFALSLSRKSAAGEALSQEDRDNLRTLETYASSLLEALVQAQAQIQTEGMSLGVTRDAMNNTAPFDALPPLDDQFDAVAQTFSQFPSLLYDGPFSDHIAQQEPHFLQGLAQISQEQAAKEAAGFLGCPPEEVNFAWEGGNQIKVFTFTREQSSISLTKQGGKVQYFKKETASSTENLSTAEALQKARALLDTAGYASLKESYYVKSDNLCTFHFSYESQEGMEVLCYPDLVKVTVELEQGEIVELDATGYLMNHQPRSFVPPALSKEDCAKNLSPALTVISSRLALIPSPGKNEVLCYEFSCTAQDGTKLLVYLNASTGLEEQLYLLQQNETGTLVI